MITNAVTGTIQTISEYFIIVFYCFLAQEWTLILIYEAMHSGLRLQYFNIVE